MICFFGCVEMTRPLAAVSRNTAGSNRRLPLFFWGNIPLGHLGFLATRHWNTSPIEICIGLLTLSELAHATGNLPPGLATKYSTPFRRPETSTSNNARRAENSSPLQQYHRPVLQPEPGSYSAHSSLRILRAPGPVARAIRVPPLGAGVERAGRSGLARVHVDLQAILDGSLLGRTCEYFKPRGAACPAATYCICSGTSPLGLRLTIFGTARSRRHRRRPADMYEVRANKQAQDQYEHKGRLLAVETHRTPLHC